VTLFSEAKGRQVVSTSTADTVGKVHELVVDPATRSVLALELKKTASGDTLRYTDITAFGEDAVTVAGADAITEAGEDVAALLGKDHHLIGKRVLSSAGDDLGKVTDVEFAAESGRVTALHLESSEVSGQRLLGVGSYAVVVAAEQ
jgi:uncharacterized protein YrrD